MKIVLAFVALSTAACGASMGPPSERLASTDAAIRSARELGAEQDPQAALHVKLASDQSQLARNLIKNGENKRADLVLQRASSDAELAVMLTKEKAANADATKAKSNLDAAKGGK